ncbi:hypothetical protein [Pseudomonas eucalypticola]|uniref:Uncharacterized protein n=1 Tax=Pseudomonas eucalypticola TaxID=2599595 RepID=A0A7D5DD32_9PSED|nr:hypothetical protein [Pseudomonas eucalypticola]QKZ07835.1 hypothetical protein HWQ56_28830 [Pseudomonas eucalypticola]
MTDDKSTWQGTAAEDIDGIIWQGTASAVIEAIKADFSKITPHELSPDDIYDRLLSARREELAEWVPNIRDMGEDAFAVLMGVLLDRLGGDGIVTHGQPAIWLQVTPAVEKQLPDRYAGARRWIRLAAIEEVHPRPGIAVGEDIRTWQYVIQVSANGKTYDVSTVRYLGAAVDAPLERLLSLVSTAVSEENRRRAQL